METHKLAGRKKAKLLAIVIHLAENTRALPATKK